MRFPTFQTDLLPPPLRNLIKYRVRYAITITSRSLSYCAEWFMFIVAFVVYMCVILRPSDENKCTDQMPDFEKMISITHEKFYVIFELICEPKLSFVISFNSITALTVEKLLHRIEFSSLPNTVLLKCHFTALTVTPEMFCADRGSFSFANNSHPDFVVV